MEFVHHTAEIIELPYREYVMIHTGANWETDTLTGKDTLYTKDVTVTIPKDYDHNLNEHLEEKDYIVNTYNDDRVTVTLKTKQHKKKPELINKLCDTIILYFENESVL